MTERRAFLSLLGMAEAGIAEADVPPLKHAATVDLAQWIMGLIAVLVALLILAWFLRRLGHVSRLESGRFRVLAALSLGSRERIVLVQAGTKQLVLGVAPGSVQTLCVLEGEDAIGIQENPSAPGSFAERLAVLSGKST